MPPEVNPPSIHLLSILCVNIPQIFTESPVGGRWPLVCGSFPPISNPPSTPNGGTNNDEIFAKLGFKALTVGYLGKKEPKSGSLTMRSSTAQNSAVQCSAVQCSAVQCSAITLTMGLTARLASLMEWP
jgi:hypothetical protein